MNYSRNSCVVLHNTTVLEVQNTISDFPRRYHNYYQKGLNGRWKCKLLKSKDNTMQLQLIDRIFEKPRGLNVPSEAPVFHISLKQADSDVILVFRYKWQKWILILVGFFTLVALLSLILALYLFRHTAIKLKAIIPFCLATFLLFLQITWLKSSSKHDLLVLQIFIELLHKNFKITVGQGDGSLFWRKTH